MHRDVSPHNVLITYGGAVKLVDFGIARLMGGEPAAAAEPGTKRKPAGGKYAYMSPEQALGAHVDHRTDVFSTGIVLWELLVGHRLYQHPDPMEKLRLVQEAVVPRLADEGIEVDDALQAMLDRALHEDPDQRYPTAAQFEEDLRAWLYDHGQANGRACLVEVMRQAFPSIDARATADLNLERMASRRRAHGAPGLRDLHPGAHPLRDAAAHRDAGGGGASASASWPSSSTSTAQ